MRYCNVVSENLVIEKKCKYAGYMSIYDYCFKYSKGLSIDPDGRLICCFECDSPIHIIHTEEEKHDSALENNS